MAAEIRVLVTRPQGQAEALLQALGEQGCSVLHLPMLRLEAIDPLPGEARQRVIDLDLYQHLIFISANAAQFGLAQIDELWPQYPADQQVWAVGESTARLLEASGLGVQRPESDMSSDGLLAMPGLENVSGHKVLIVKGEGGRERIRETLTERGAIVHTLSCYRRLAPDLDGVACREQLEREPVDLILASSGEGLGHLTRLLQPKENTNLADTTLVVPSARVADQAGQLGWRRVHCAANASDACMLETVVQWRQALCDRPLGEQR